jgi:hypothetical protein
VIPGVTTQKYGQYQHVPQAIGIAQPQLIAAAVSHAFPKAIAASIASVLTAARAKAVPKLISPRLGQAINVAGLKAKIFQLSLGQRVKLRVPLQLRITQPSAVSMTLTTDAATLFLARTSGLDSTHTTAYTNLINGLVSDGVWSKLDVLYVFATADTTTALLNLKSANFTGITHGPPTFTVDRGFTGADLSTTIWIDSGFNATTASGAGFTANSCHISAWVDTNGASNIVIGIEGDTGTNRTNIYPWNSTTGNSEFRINDSGSSAGVSIGNSTGHWVASRTSSTVSTGYRNGSSVATPNAAAGTLQNGNIYVLAVHNIVNGASGYHGSSQQVSAASIGAGLSSTDASNFYTRLRTYMTAVGVP